MIGPFVIITHCKTSLVLQSQAAWQIRRQLLHHLNDPRLDPATPPPLAGIREMISQPAQQRAEYPCRGCGETRRWREMDSNFQYAGAVNLVVWPFLGGLCFAIGCRSEALLGPRGISDAAARS